MIIDFQRVAQFKAALQQAKDSNREAWESSTKLVGHASIDATLTRLAQAIQASDQSTELKEMLVRSLPGQLSGTIHQAQGRSRVSRAAPQ